MWNFPDLETVQISIFVEGALHIETGNLLNLETLWFPPTQYVQSVRCQKSFSFYPLQISFRCVCQIFQILRILQIPSKAVCKIPRSRKSSRLPYRMVVPRCQNWNLQPFLFSWPQTRNVGMAPDSVLHVVAEGICATRVGVGNFDQAGSPAACCMCMLAAPLTVYYMPLQWESVLSTLDQRILISGSSQSLGIRACYQPFLSSWP